MRTFGTLFVTGILACTVGCGGGSGATSSSGRSGSNGGQCPSSSSGQTCTGEDAYQTCALNVCGTQYKACFGNNYASGNFAGGSCADWIGCEMQCPCDATAQTCEGTCASQYLDSTAGQTCSTCLTTLGYCVASSGCAQPVCTPNPTGTNTTTATNTTTTGTGCAGALACCQTIAATAGAQGPALAQQCQSALAGQTEAVCNTILSTYQSEGLCQ